MKTMNNNNIERMNNIVANNEEVLEWTIIEGKIGAVQVTEPVGERVGFIYDHGSGGMVAVNEPKGWRLDKKLSFADGFNHYVKGHVSLGKAVAFIAEEFGLRPDDTSEWGCDIRSMVQDFVEHFDEYLNNEDFLFDEVGDPDACDGTMNDYLFHAIIMGRDIVNTYEG